MKPCRQDLFHHVFRLQMRNNTRVWRSQQGVSCNVDSQHVSVIIHFHRKSYLGTRMCYICCSMLVVIVSEKVSVRDETRWKNKQKVTRARSLSLCCSQVSVKKRERKTQSCTFPERRRRVSFTTPDQNLPKFVTTIMSRSLSNRWA